jgi:hypothetical protein
MGFVIATGTSHLCGIAFGGLSRWPAGRIAVGAVGAAISLIGFSVDSYERTFAYCAQSLPGRCRDAVDGMPCRHVPGIASLDGSVRSIAILLAGAPPLKTVTGITASLLPAGYEAAFQLEETTHASKQEVYA